VTQKYIVNSVYLALVAMWVAVVLVCALLPAFSILGTPAVVTVASFVASALTAPILGPIWGTTAGFVYGWLVPFVNPSTALFGPLTFLSPTMGALVSGLVLFNRWKEATLILCSEIVIWFLNPFAWYEAMPIITWEYWLALGLVVVPPVRKWIVNELRSRNPDTLPIALWSLAWVARIGGDVLTGNNIGVWIYSLGGPSMYPYWVPLTAYYAIADSLVCLFGAILGTALLIALKRANLRFIAVDFLESKERRLDFSFTP
jgi:hypothetical protein